MRYDRRLVGNCKVVTEVINREDRLLGYKVIK